MNWKFISIIIILIAILFKLLWNKYWIYVPAIVSQFKNPVGPYQEMKWKQHSKFKSNSIANTNANTQSSILNELPDNIQESEGKKVKKVKPPNVILIGKFVYTRLYVIYMYIINLTIYLTILLYT